MAMICINYAILLLAILIGFLVWFQKYGDDPVAMCPCFNKQLFDKMVKFDLRNVLLILEIFTVGYLDVGLFYFQLDCQFINCNDLFSCGFRLLAILIGFWFGIGNMVTRVLLLCIRVF